MKAPGAVVLGTMCVIGTLIVLFGHIRSVDDLTINHLYILLALLVTLGAGHYMWDAYSEGWMGVARGLSLSVLFVVGTLICVGLSGARSAAILEAKERHALDADDARKAQAVLTTDAEAALIQAQALADDANVKATADEDAAAKECASGKGSRCDGRSSSAAISRANANRLSQSLEGAKQWHREQLIKLNGMHPPEPPNAELKHFAKVIALITGKTPHEAMSILKDTIPYALSLLTEFGVVVFYNVGFGHRTAPARPTRPASPTPHTTVTVNDIARELGVTPVVVRRHLRELQVAKPSQGWVWPHDEANDIKSKIQTARASAPSPAVN